MLLASLLCRPKIAFGHTSLSQHGQPHIYCLTNHHCNAYTNGSSHAKPRSYRILDTIGRLSGGCVVSYKILLSHIPLLSSSSLALTSLRYQLSSSRHVAVTYCLADETVIMLYPAPQHLQKRLTMLATTMPCDATMQYSFTVPCLDSQRRISSNETRATDR